MCIRDRDNDKECLKDHKWEEACVQKRVTEEIDVGAFRQAEKILDCRNKDVINGRKHRKVMKLRRPTCLDNRRHLLFI